MKINVQDAMVKTAVVEVKSLSISGKQVTLAVFRQLVEEDVLAFDEHGLATTRGPIWGMVNYHPDADCKQNGFRHIHVVWQRGNELRRSLIDVGKLLTSLTAPYVCNELDAEWTRAAFLEGRFTDWSTHRLERVLVNLDGFRCRMWVPEDVTEALRWGVENRSVEQPQRSFDELTALIVEDLKRDRDARKANIELATALEALPQLFIAV